MNLESKKTSLIILGITSLVFSRTMFLFFNDPEGPNLLIVVGMALIVYFLSLTAYLFTSPIPSFKKLLLAILIQLIMLTAFYGIDLVSHNPSPTQGVKEEGSNNQLNLEQDAKNYVTAHISELSPEKEVLGGKFYVTKISSNESTDGSIVSGDVSYEDGHNSYSAYYVFTINPDHSLSLKSFEITK